MRNHSVGFGVMVILVVSLLTAFIVPGQVLAVERTEHSGSIQVTGTAVVTGSPDMAIITLGVETKDPSAQVASQENANRMETVFAALKEMGLSEKELTTSGYNIYSSNQVIARGTENEVTVTTYHVQNKITITTKELDKVGTIIDVAIKAGANQVQGIRFDIQDKQAMQLQALKNAVQQGKAKAEIMAEAAGITLGGLATMNESYSSHAPVISTMAARSEAFAASPTTINPGEVEVSATVSMNFWF